MLKCKCWKKYTGKIRPKCDGGLGCNKCWEIYNNKHRPPDSQGGSNSNLVCAYRAGETLLNH